MYGEEDEVLATICKTMGRPESWDVLRHAMEGLPRGEAGVKLLGYSKKIHYVILRKLVDEGLVFYNGDHFTYYATMMGVHLLDVGEDLWAMRASDEIGSLSVGDSEERIRKIPIYRQHEQRLKKVAEKNEDFLKRDADKKKAEEEQSGLQNK